MSRTVFESRGRTYTLGHVFAAAAFGGWTGGFWKDLEDGLACAAYAEDEGFEIDTAELQESADRFRYQRNLVTAEETERWLSDRDVDEDDLVGWLERCYWRRRFSREARQIGDSYTPAPSVITDVLWPEVVYSGHLGTLAIPLARRVAAAAADKDAGPHPIGSEPADEARSAFFARAGCGPEDLDQWLDRNHCTMAWFRELLVARGALSSHLQPCTLPRTLLGFAGIPKARPAAGQVPDGPIPDRDACPGGAPVHHRRRGAA